MKLSIVIPVYRVESTLNRCVESVTGQTYTDIEVILVDDDSPDGCPAMCDEWARKDRRISVIHKENGGLSDARNAGIAAARGQFVTFADSDDFLDPTTYEKVMARAEDNDIVEFPLYRHYGSAAQEAVLFGEETYDDMGRYWLGARAYEHAYAWNKVYRRSLFSHVRFPKGKVFEDVDTLPRLLAHARKVATTGQGMYYYCQNRQGITATARGPELTMLLEARLRTAATWCDDTYYMHVLNIQMDVAEMTGMPPRLPYRAVSPLADGLRWPDRLKALMVTIIGVRKICKLNKTIHQWRGRG